MVENSPSTIAGPVGWHSRGYLPHFDSPDVVQTIVFRLADSLPKHLIGPSPAPSPSPAMAVALDAALDSGGGACWLRRPDIAGLAEAALLLHFDGARYRLLAWCVMPNHVHAMLEVLPGHRLGDIVRSWKSHVGREANRPLDRSGAFWSRDYFDRYIRDSRHHDHALAYIEHNPVKAGLADRPQDWPWSSARRRPPLE